MVNFHKKTIIILLTLMAFRLVCLCQTADDGRKKIFEWQSEQLTHDKVKEMGYTSLPANMKTPVFNVPTRCRIYIDGKKELVEGGIGCLYGGHWWLTRSDGTNIDNAFYGWPDSDGSEIHSKEYLEPGSYYVSFSIQHNISIPFICEQKWSFGVYVMPDLPQLVEEDGNIFTWEGLKADPVVTVEEGELSVLPGTVFEGNGEVKLRNNGESCSINGDLKLYQPGLFCKIVTSKDGQVEILPIVTKSGDSLASTGFLSAGTRFLGSTAKKGIQWVWKNKWTISGGHAIKMMTGIYGFVFTLPTTIGARALGKNWDSIVERMNQNSNELTISTWSHADAPKGYAVTMVKSSCILHSPDGKSVTIYTFKGEAVLSDINRIKTVRILPGYVASCEQDQLPTDPRKFSMTDIEKKWEEIVYRIKTQKSPQSETVPAGKQPEARVQPQAEESVEAEAVVSANEITEQKETEPETVPTPTEPVAPVEKQPETVPPTVEPNAEVAASAEFLKNETIREGLYTNRKWGFQVAVPSDSWEIVTGSEAVAINRDATVVLKTDTAYVLVIGEKLSGMDMNTFKAIALPRMENRQVISQKSSPSADTEKMSFEIGGVLEGREFVFYTLLIKRGDFFYQVHCWTYKSLYSETRPDFDKILKSFLIAM